MQKSIMAAAAAAAFMAFSPAHADQSTGTIIAIDVVLHQIVLSDGTVYRLPKSVPAARLTIGSKVRVTYTTVNGTNAATAVTRVK